MITTQMPCYTDFFLIQYSTAKLSLLSVLFNASHKAPIKLPFQVWNYSMGKQASILLPKSNKNNDHSLGLFFLTFVECSIIYYKCELKSFMSQTKPI